MPITQELSLEVNEVDLVVHSRREWRALWQSMPALFADRTIESLAEHVRLHGLVDPQRGHVAANDVLFESTNYRETVEALGLISRTRGLLLMLQDVMATLGGQPEVFASEALSPLAQRLSDTLPHFEGSEYLPTDQDRNNHPGVIHQNVQALAYADDRFDIYVSCDVLEHVPDLDQALREAARVLRPGGVMMGTVPFAAKRDETLVRARLINGEVEHVLPPEYHGNPTRPDEGSLVYQVPGWDLFDRFRAAGFSQCGLRLICSRRHGVFGAGFAFSPYFFAQKS